MVFLGVPTIFMKDLLRINEHIWRICRCENTEFESDSQEIARIKILQKSFSFL